MSDDLNLDPIISSIGFNDGANKGFWRIQPRDDEGQWIEMGADVLFRFRTGEGNLVVGTARGVYVGPSGRPGFARVMVTDKESGLEPRVYEVESRNLQQFKALLPDSDGEAKKGERLDKFGKPVRTLEDSKLPDVKALLNNSQPISKEDERLARGELTPEEREAEQDGRKNSPIADMPAGFEAENPEEVRNLLRESGIDPDEFDQTNTEPKPEAAATEKPKQERGEKPKAYGIRNWNEFRDLPDGTVLDEYERAQFYPSPEDYRGANGPVWRSYVKQDGKWFLLGKNGKPKGKPLNRSQVSALVQTNALTDSGAGFKIDEKGNKVPAWGDEPNAMLPEPEISIDQPRPVANEAYLEAFDSGEKPDIDKLIQEESMAALRETTRKAVPFDLERGNVILRDGEELTVVDVELGSVNEDRPARVTVQKADGTIEELTPKMTDRLDVITGRRRAPVRPPRPNTPEVVPASKDQLNELIDLESKGIDNPELAAEVEELLNSRGPVDSRRADDLILRVRESQSPAPKAEPEESTGVGEGGDDFTGATDVPSAPGIQPVNFPPKDRIDDGSEFELPVLTTEQIDAARDMQLTPLMDSDGTPGKYVNENNNVVEAEDPFAMMAALAKIYPNAKFTPEGALVLHRQKDRDGRIFELRANNSGKKAIVYSMRWTDPATGEFKEYQHKDDRHSIKALLRKDNGPQDLLDRLLGRVDNNGKDWGLPENYKFGSTRYQRTDSLFKRLKWFMSGTGDRKKMEELSDNAVRLAKGRATVYHDDGTVKNSSIPSVWDAFNAYFTSGATAEERDVEARDDLYQSLYGVFGRAPLDEKSHAIYREALRAEFKRQFPEASTAQVRSFGGLVTSASERMRGIYREPSAQVRSIRYASKDRTRAIEVGMTTEYTNNVGETTIVKVNSLIENTNATTINGSSYDYGDNVVITDVNGRKIKVNALKLKILANQNTPLTVYKPNLQLEELRQRRIELGQWLPQNRGESSTPRARRPYIGTTGIPGQNTIISDPAPDPKLIDDFVTGDMLYNKEGRPLGVIKAVRPITGRNGTPGLAFLYQKADGTEGQASYALGTEITPKKA